MRVPIVLVAMFLLPGCGSPDNSEEITKEIEILKRQITELRAELYDAKHTDIEGLGREHDELSRQVITIAEHTRDLALIVRDVQRHVKDLKQTE